MRTNNQIPGIIALIGSVLLHTAPAAVLNVPADFAGIQQAIDASAPGDVVLVSPGIYLENISFKGKAITVTGTAPEDLAVVRNTIIRAAVQGSVVSFTNSETSNSVLAGFTITGGYGTVNPLIITNVYWGGGIYCFGSAPTIVRNVIEANTGPVQASRLGYGCGIACVASDALISRNLITGNGGYAGAGIITYLGKPRVVSNVICSNSAAIAGGAIIIGAGEFVNNTVTGNSATNLVGGVYAISDTGLQAMIRNNIICNSLSGGGFYTDAEDTISKVSFNNVWNNSGGNYPSSLDRTGTQGNISVDPQFWQPESADYRLLDVSPCVNAGDPEFQAGAGEMDFYGSPRVYGGRADIGASEYFDPFRPIADAGTNQFIAASSVPVIITLDGSASSDPGGLALSYQWTQISGPPATLINSSSAQGSFAASQPGTYKFQLIVSNGTLSSLPDAVEIIIHNGAPTARAGDDQIYSPSEVPVIRLDGSGSFDPENGALTYTWRQINGWKVALSDYHAVNPTLVHPWPGTYIFELVVNDGLQDSEPDYVVILIGTNHAPVANAGAPAFIASGTLMLDGRGSYDPDGVGNLTYYWKQVSGAKVPISDTNSPTSIVGPFTPTTSIQKIAFQLIVSDGYLTSAASPVVVTVVPNYGSNTLVLANPPFDASRPTILSFGGGNCNTGGSMTWGGAWNARANWITVLNYGPAYTKYGDMLMVYLYGVAPDYKQAIQTVGFSTGNKPAMEVAWYVNSTYKDARYAVNRVALLDPVCNDLSARVASFNANRVAGEQCWVDNYISNDSQYRKAVLIPGAFNIYCDPARNHGYPVDKYASRSLDYSNAGMTAYGYLSVIGTGKNYQLNTSANRYYFKVNSSESLVFYNQTLYPGKILAPVNLTGPTNGSVLAAAGATLGCDRVENAVKYQLLYGFDPNRVMDFTVVAETTNTPSFAVTTLPYQYTWWTVRAFDQFGSTMHADPRLIQSPENQVPTANAGPDQVLYANLDGIASVILDGSGSTDPDGDTLGYTWAWSLGGTAFLTNSVSLSLDLPVGEHTIQLMVNDRQAYSEPDEVKVTVVAPLECEVKAVPSAINLRGHNPHVLARIVFPAGVSKAEVSNAEGLSLYPSGVSPVRRWVTGADGDRVVLFALFDSNALSGLSDNNAAELTIAGKLKSGQWFYGSDHVKVIGKPKDT